MRSERLFAMLAAFFAALIFMAADADTGLAQTTGIPTTAEKDSTIGKKVRPAPRYPRHPVDPATPRLILDGQLIPGPYEVVIQDSTIRINGIVAFAPPERPKKTERPAEAAADTSLNMQQYKLERAFFRAFGNWVAERGFDTACTLAVGYMRRQPLVDSAYWMGPGAFCVLFKGERDANVYELYPPMEDQPPPRTRWEEVLEFVAGGVRGALSDGSLVIMQDGHWRPIPSPKRVAVLKQLQDIVASEPDMERRIAAIKKIVRDERAAKSIAEKLAPR